MVTRIKMSTRKKGILDKTLSPSLNMDQLVLDIRQKLNMLELKNQEKDSGSAQQIRHELDNIRLQLHDPEFRKQIHFNIDPELTTYPEYDDEDFLPKIFYKKEFLKDRYMPIESTKGYVKLAEEECSGQHFRLTPNQIFLKHFMSFFTPYNNLLIFHGVGVGKCHQKDTGIICYDGRIKKVQDIRVGDSLMGDDSYPRRVTSLARGWDCMYRVYNDKCQFTVNSEHILVLLFCPFYSFENSASYSETLDDGRVQTICVYVKCHRLVYEVKIKNSLTMIDDSQDDFYEWISTKAYSNHSNHENDDHDFLYFI